MDGWALPFLTCVLLVCGGVAGSEYELGAHPRFICTPIPPDAPCLPSDSTGQHSGHRSGHYGEHHSRRHGGHYSGHHGDSWWGVSDEATSTILHLRESLVQQKETILDQRETIRELTSKLALCQGFGHGLGGQEHAQYGHYHGNEEHTGDETLSLSRSPEQMSHMLAMLKERLENLQVRERGEVPLHTTLTKYYQFLLLFPFIASPLTVKVQEEPSLIVTQCTHLSYLLLVSFTQCPM